MRSFNLAFTAGKQDKARRLTTVIAICVVWLAQLPATGFAQSYPSKPVRLLLGFAPGSAIDVISRQLAQKLSESLGQQVVVDSRPGATGIIANELLTRSAPNGYTLLYAPSSAIASAPHLYKVQYRHLDDFAPVVQVGSFSFVLVSHPNVPLKTVRELIALAKAKPGVLTYGSPRGTGFHLAGELFATMAGVQLLHVPYSAGGATPRIDLLTGRLDLGWDSLAVLQPYLQAGKLRVIAVTGSRRATDLPSVPTIAESGLPGYEMMGWHGVFAPAAASKDIISLLNAVTAKILARTDIKELWAKIGMEFMPNTPEQFAEQIRLDYERLGKLIKNSGITIQR